MLHDLAWIEFLTRLGATGVPRVRVRDIYSRAGLSVREREIATVAILKPDHHFFTEPDLL